MHLISHLWICHTKSVFPIGIKLRTFMLLMQCSTNWATNKNSAPFIFRTSYKYCWPFLFRWKMCRIVLFYLFFWFISYLSYHFVRLTVWLSFTSNKECWSENITLSTKVNGFVCWCVWMRVVGYVLVKAHSCANHWGGIYSSIFILIALLHSGCENESFWRI